ncbi:hypothetical protein QTP88_019511 [Uroleucon formosanum]
MTAADIFDVVTGKSKKPVLTKSNSETKDEAKKRYGVDYSIFKKSDNKAQKYIVTSVNEQPLQYIMNCDTAKEMWDKLLSVYEQKSDSSVTLIQQKFYSYVINLDDNMGIHISKLESLSRKLKHAWDSIHNELVDIMVKYLKNNFETKEGELDHFLGIEIDQRPDGSIFIHQSLYCKRILERFNMEEANVLHIPTDPQHSLDPNLSGSLEAGEVPFRESVGSLLYLSQITRPDNQSAIKLVKNPEYHKRTKHIDVRYHYIREKFSEGMFTVEYAPSKEQLADILTKPIPRPRFQELREMLGIRYINSKLGYIV